LFRLLDFLITRLFLARREQRQQSDGGENSHAPSYHPQHVAPNENGPD
jgi:hypothetical protein